jgi:hypothetical protein
MHVLMPKNQIVTYHNIIFQAFIQDYLLDGWNDPLDSGWIEPEVE